MKTLIVDNDRLTQKDVSFCLEVLYHDVNCMVTINGLKGIELAKSEAPNLVLADFSLSDIDIFDFIRTLREFSDVPILILSDNISAIDVARCLEAGADEVILKPISPIGFLARVKTILRRAGVTNLATEKTVSVTENLSINFATHEVFLSGNKVKLTRTEYQLLSELVKNEGRVMTLENLLEKAWGSDYASDYSYVKKYIYRLRTKLEPDDSKPQMFLSERGVGYRFVRPVAK